jgi:D-3-phosphoglycerate dehydrogenase
MHRAIYIDVDDTDTSAGEKLLADAGFTVTKVNSKDPAVIVSAAQNCQAMLLGYAELTSSMIEQLPELKIVSLMAMGFDNIDIEACKARGIWVTNIPGAATDDVATHALALTLSMLRQLPFYQNSAVSNWNSRGPLAPPRISDLTLGLVGLGRIGLKFAEFARPLFGSIVGYDPFVGNGSEAKQKMNQLGIKQLDLDSILKTSDVVSIHVPLSNETESIVNEKFLSKMKSGSYFLNVSRGGLVDSAALSEALSSGKLVAAALDTIDQEPAESNHPLLSNPRVLLTPHVAYFSSYTEKEYTRVQAANVVSWISTGKPETPLFSIVETKKGIN